jgi:hypothetical protein
MTTKLVKELLRGDRVSLDDGVGTITQVARCDIISCRGGAYAVGWTDQRGRIGQVIVAGNTQVELEQSEIL